MYHPQNSFDTIALHRTHNSQTYVPMRYRNSIQTTTHKCSLVHIVYALCHLFLFPNFNYVCSHIDSIYAIIGSLIYERTIHSFCRATTCNPHNFKHFGIVFFRPSSGKKTSLRQPLFSFINKIFNYCIPTYRRRFLSPFNCLAISLIDSINHLIAHVWRPSVRNYHFLSICLFVSILIYYWIYCKQQTFMDWINASGC